MTKVKISHRLRVTQNKKLERKLCENPNIDVYNLILLTIQCAHSLGIREPSFSVAHFHIGIRFFSSTINQDIESIPS